MAWVKLDDQFFSHPKVQRAGRDARDLYLAGLTYCARGRTDGAIPQEALRLLAAMADIDGWQTAAAKLVEVGLWEPTQGGYMVHDYLDYNPTRERIEEVRKARAEAGSRGGLASGASRTQAKTKQIASPVASDGVKQNPTPSSSSSSSSSVEESTQSDGSPLGASAPGGTATFADWQRQLERATNRQAVLQRLFKVLFPDREAPSFSELGGAARDVGGAGRLAELLWQASTRPPTGDILKWCRGMAKGGNGSRASPRASPPHGGPPGSDDEVMPSGLTRRQERLNRNAIAGTEVSHGPT